MDTPASVFTHHSFDLDFLKSQAKTIRRLILETTHHAGMGHTGGSLSEVEILTALFFQVMQNINPKHPCGSTRDRFILSKGHASPGYYATLALRGYFPLEALKTFDELGTILQAHPDMHKTPGVDISSGSLGQGLSCGVGMALAALSDPQLNRFCTFVLMGDGELQEGQIWEAALYAGSRSLPGIVGIIDCNAVQLASKTHEAVNVEPVGAKWQAFGWTVLEADGHNMFELTSALIKARQLAATQPVLVVAHTVKGKGVSFMEGNYEWHGKAPNKQEYLNALKELDDAGW